MPKRLRVYRTFLLGLLIGLLFAVMVSDHATGLGLPAWLGLIEQRVLVLTFSGILGGVIYTIMVDGHVELPRFVDERGDRFEAGLLGDMLLGIAGAFILEFLTSPIGASPEVRQQLWAETPYLIFAIKGIIGGYGSKSLMDLALDRFMDESKRLKREARDIEQENRDLEETAEQLETQKQYLLEGQALIQQLNRHIDPGITDAERAILLQSIRSASPEVKQQVFDLTRHFRSTTSRTVEFRASTQRTICIFVALVESDRQRHAYHAQLAYAYKDSEVPLSQPTLDRALEHLNQAIALRSSAEASATWKYELNRAILLIEKEQRRGAIALTQVSATDAESFWRDRIVADLLVVAHYHGIRAVVNHAQANHIPNPITAWMLRHQDWLSTQENTRDLFLELQPFLRDESENVESPESPESPEFIDADDTELLSEETVGAVEPSSSVVSIDPVVDSAASPDDGISDDLTEEQIDEEQAEAVPDEAAIDRTPTTPPASESYDLETLEAELDVEWREEPSASETPEPDWSAGTDGQSDEDRIAPPPDELLSSDAFDRWSAALYGAQSTGADDTASRAGLKFTGALASYQLARQDLPRVKPYLERFRWAGAKFGIPPALLAAIASRESCCGADLNHRGYSKDGHAFGILQIDGRSHTPSGSGGQSPDPASQGHLDEGADLLAMYLRDMDDHYPDWDDSARLQGAIAAYNIGVEQVHRTPPLELDRKTTGHDYSADVLARAKFYAETFPSLAIVPSVDALLQDVTSVNHNGHHSLPQAIASHTLG